MVAIMAIITEPIMLGKSRLRKGSLSNYEKTFRIIGKIE